MIRLIPRLDIKGPNLVKGIHLEGLRVLGNPAEFARFYYEDGADEIILQDVVASLYQRNSLFDIVNSIAKEIFIPLTVGGGLKSLYDIKEILRAGADKVSINTAAINDPHFIRKAANEFGSSTITVAIEVSKNINGDFICFTDNGREETNLNALVWAKRAEELGAGEILITSIEKEGTRSGIDIELLSLIEKNISIPIIYHGGVGKNKDILDAVLNNANAISVASILHYSILDIVNHRGIKNKEGNYTYLTKKKNVNNKYSIMEIKKYLKQNNIICRL